MRIISAALILSAYAAPAYAGDKYVVQPVQVGAETVRYYKGSATVDLPGARGSIQVRPLTFDHGGMSFGIAVFNGSDSAANFDISALSITVDGVLVKVYSRQELEKKAKNRAMWTMVALAAVGGLAAASAASQRDTYSATTYTPHGTYHTYISTPSTTGQVEAAAITAGTGYSLSRVRSQLDNTLDDLGDSIIQLTTVDPGNSYAGRVILAKTKIKKVPAQVRMTITWNGEPYVLGFQVAKDGTAAPIFTNLTPPAPAEPTPAAAAPS